MCAVNETVARVGRGVSNRVTGGIKVVLRAFTIAVASSEAQHRDR